MEGHFLPHGARGIETEDFAIEFRRSKVVFIAKAARATTHYTLQAGLNSGVIDLHETEHDASRQPYRTLFAMRRDELEVLLAAIYPVVPEMLALLRPLRIGWVKHRDIHIVRGLDPVSDAEIAAVTRKRKKRLMVDPHLYEQNVCVLKNPCDVKDYPDGNFSLVHRGRPIGLGFKITSPDARLFWIKRRDLMRLGNKWQAIVERALADVGIPREDYPQHPFLRS